jgi:hypothetical protein
LLFGRSGFSKTTAVPTPQVVQFFYKAKAVFLSKRVVKQLPVDVKIHK